MQRIAVPMIGGMVSSTILTLVVIPAIYALVKGRGLAGGDLATTPIVRSKTERLTRIFNSAEP